MVGCEAFSFIKGFGVEGLGEVGELQSGEVSGALGVEAEEHVLDIQTVLLHNRFHSSDDQLARQRDVLLRALQRIDRTSIHLRRRQYLQYLQLEWSCIVK